MPGESERWVPREVEALLEAFHGYFGYVSLDGLVLEVNDLPLRLTGLQRSDIIGHHVWDAPWWETLPESREVVRGIIEDAKAGATARSDVLFWNRVDARMGWTAFGATPIRDDAGRVTHIAVAAVDVTARHDAQRDLSEFVESMPQMAFVADASGAILGFNRQFRAYFGVEGEIDTRAWKDAALVHPEDLEPTVERWTRAMQTGEPYEMEYRLRRHDGAYRWHLGRALAVRDENGDVRRWFGTNTDIHDLHMLRANLEDERELREKFVSMLTHDLRTPLAAAAVGADLLQRAIGERESVTRIVRLLRRNIDRMDHMIRDLLDASRVRAGQALPVELEPGDLTKLVADAVDGLRALYGDRVVLRVDAPIHGRWSKQGIARIVDNLVGNAVKYGSENRPISVSVQATVDEAVIEVFNHGRAIDPEEIPQMFAAFRRSPSAGTKKGWGIGLALVKGIAEAHGGTAGARSIEGEGTTFWVRLPRHAKKRLDVAA